MVSVDLNNLQYYYNQYIIEWFAKNRDRPVSDAFVLRQKYLFLLDQLQLFFTDQEKSDWYNQLALADHRELLTSIPYFARRLKDIALYYLKLRKKIKGSKKQFSSVGTTTSIEKQIYYHLLEVFSTNNSELTPEFGATIPSLGLLQKNLAVQVEELYDDKQYFDLSPNKPTEQYFNLLHDATSNFFATKGITLSSSHWLFDSFNLSPDGNFDSIFDSLTGRIFETGDTELYNSFVQKYIGQTKSSVTIPTATLETQTYDVEINEGNNFFYYPYGTNSTTFSLENQLVPVSLSSLDFTQLAGGDRSPTAGDSLATSDVIYVRYGREMKGAWLRYQPYEDYNQTIITSIKKDSNTSFVFPFPGLGLSSTDFEWTGFAFETTPEYDFLSREMKAAVNEAYKSAPLPVDTCEPIALNNTTLAQEGSLPGLYPFESDQIFVRDSREDNTATPLGSPNGAWLYRFLKTSIAVSPNETNVFVWPYGLIDQGASLGVYQYLDYNNVCRSININELSNHAFIASTNFDTADKIYKLNSYTGDENSALECAWLSGTEVSNGKYAFVQQDGFNALFTSDEPVRFVWTGPNTKLKDVFSQIQHKEDCPFTTKNLTEAEWTQCSCKQVYHSPFGHPNKRFEEGYNFADCIVKVPRTGMDTFDFSSWIDSDGNTVFNSISSFAWFRTNNKIGWGDGSWVSNVLDTEPFELEHGKCYFYRRSENRSAPAEGMPSYIVNYNFGTKNTKWILAKKEASGEWVQGYDIESSMSINPGDFLKIERKPNFVSYALSSVEIRNESYSQEESLWSTHTNIPYFCGEEQSTNLSWPVFDDPYKLATHPQSPKVAIGDIQSIYGWTITRLEGTNAEWLSASYTILGEQTLTFAPPTTGTFCISLTANTLLPSLSTITATSETSAADLKRALDADVNQAVEVIEREDGLIDIKFDPTGIPQAAPTLVIPNENTYIPCISAFAPYSIETTRNLFYTNAGGFVIEHQLNGWDYSRSDYDGVSQGAKPYWAYLGVEKDSTTRLKGVYSWGFPDEYIDDYLPNNNPIISPIMLSYGNVIDYERMGYSFSWQQPIIYKSYINKTQWCLLSADYSQYSNLSGLYFTKRRFEPSVFPTTTPSDIVLSNLINALPLEIYYNALRPFTWSISATLPFNSLTTLGIAPSAELFYVSESPWQSLQNRFFPTIASVPVLEETYTTEEVGGYFLPHNLGASLFINKEYDVTLKKEISSGSFIVEDTSKYVGGRGRSQEDQPTVYEWSENNQWLKEGITTGDLAGATKRNLTKTLQTFVPYQSNDENTAIGIITTESRVSPWGGYQDSEWTDLENEPKSFTGVRRVQDWGKSQVIKNIEKSIDKWASDVYGNQYGLYKDLTNISLADRNDTPGEIWVRNNAQKVSRGDLALSEVFTPFNVPTLSSVYIQLTGSGILDFQCYFDTLYFKTNNAVIFAKVAYDYSNKQITSTFDNIQYVLLNENLKFEKNWFFSKEKRIVTLFTNISNNSFYPELWQLDLLDRTYNRIYPVGSAAKEEIKNTLAFVFAKQLKDSSLYYNKSHNQFLVTYTGVAGISSVNDPTESLFMLDLTLLYQDEVLLSKANYFFDRFTLFEQTDEPPLVEPSVATQIYPITSNVTFNLNIPTLNYPTSCRVLNSTAVKAITAVNNVVSFTGKLPTGLYHVNYVLNNTVGSTTYCLTLSAL